MSDEKTTKSHPSYGLFSISRISGGDGRLFGSSIRHQHSIRITISRAEVVRDLSNHWYHDKEELIEIDMSPSQWAEAITSMNFGVGTPCTLRYIDGKSMPKCEQDNERELFEKEFEKQVFEATDGFKEKLVEISSLLREKKNLTKSDRETIIGAINSLSRIVRDSIPFIQSQFNESMDKTVASAKGEVEAYALQLSLESGLKLLTEINESPRIN